LGQGPCPGGRRPITAQTREPILARILALPEGTRFLVLAPVIRGQKGEYKDLFEDMLKRGFVRARVDGQVVRLTDDLKLDRRIKHYIEIVIDRLKNEPKVRPRLAEAVDQALALGEGNLIVAVEAEASPGRPRPAGRRRRAGGVGPRRALGGLTPPARRKSTKTSSSPRTTPAPSATAVTSRQARSSSASTARRGCAPIATASASATPSTPSCSS